MGKGGDSGGESARVGQLYINEYVPTCTLFIVCVALLYYCKGQIVILWYYKFLFDFHIVVL